MCKSLRTSVSLLAHRAQLLMGNLRAWMLAVCLVLVINAYPDLAIEGTMISISPNCAKDLDPILRARGLAKP